MQLIIEDMSLNSFKAWEGAISTQDKILEADKEAEFEAWIDELYPDGITDTELNDLLWFDSENILRDLGINEDEENEND